MGMSETLGKIYAISIAIVFGTVFFSTFWRLWKLVFLTKNFSKCYIYVFFFIQKTAKLVLEKNFHNSGVVSRRKLRDSLGNVFNLFSISLR